MSNHLNMCDEKKGPVRELQERVLLLEKQVKDLNADYLRAVADFDNFRKRLERELVAQQRAGIDSLLEALIVVLDNFERSLKNFPLILPEPACNDAAENWKKGVELIYKQLCAILAQFGLREYSCLNEKFDPRRAEAIGFIDVEEGEANQVVEEVCKGYECAGRVLRPAKVMVARQKTNENIDQQKSESKS
ncbi:MAG: nucleotide exchange factor GrpE [bacterium]